MATEKRLSRANQRLNGESSKKCVQIKKRLVLKRANIEISRILNGLNLPLSLKSLVVEKFNRFWTTTNPATKYRSHEMLVPLAIYSALQSQQISIREDELLKVSKLSKKKFNALKRILQ